MYRDLAAAGEPLETVKSLGERHALILLQHWRDRRWPPARTRSQWPNLRMSLRAIGKADCAKNLRNHRPDAPRVAVDRCERGAIRQGDAGLIASLREDRDPTRYQVARLCQQRRLSVQEAPLFPVADPDAILRDSRSIRQLQAARHTAPAAVDEVLQTAAGPVAQRACPTLLWPELNLAQATRRHGNCLAYPRRMRAGAGKSK